MAVRAFYDLPAPAKINLFLHVVGRRADGYHLLRSLFVLVDWCDSLHIEWRPDGRLQRHDLGLALPADDLCLRAARALQSASGCRAGADISIAKQVPWGAGMGGGSSDAATTLLALNRLWGLGWPRSRLMEIGLSIGADVPFFIGGDNALVEGIGERLSPVVVSPRWLAVLKPPASIETRALFASLARAREFEADTIFGSPLEGHATLKPKTGLMKAELGVGGQGEGGLDEAGLDEAGRSQAGGNDLQAAAERQCADVARAAAVLDRHFGNSRMTGSGSAVFARVGPFDASAVRPPMAENPEPGWIGRMCLSLRSHPLRDWAGA